MATFKAVVRTPRKDGFFQVYIRVVHNTKPGYIKTDKIVTKQMVDKYGNINDPFVSEYCARMILLYTDKLNRKDCARWTVRQIIEYVTQGEDDICFSDYARQYIDRMVDRFQLRTAQNYRQALGHMERFCGTNKIMFAQLTSTQITRWIQSLEQTHRAKEMYPVCMRQVFKAAVEEFNDYDNGNLRIKVNPWGKVKIPQSDRTVKKAISPEDCRLFFAAPLPATRMVDPLPELGRDVAKMVLCLAGMNTVDIYELRKEDYRNGRICYKRAKTKKFRADDAYFEIRVEPIIQPLVEKYLAEADDPYLLNFHKRFSSSDSFNANVNNGIKQICNSMGMPKERWYSAYTFRHTWGTVAQNVCAASIDEVAFAMNHASGHRVTRGYLRLDFSPAWRLNEQVVDLIFFSDAETEKKDPEAGLFRFSAKHLIHGAAYFRGRLLGEVRDTGFNNIDEVISMLVPFVPDDVPSRSMVQFKIDIVDKDLSQTYELSQGLHLPTGGSVRVILTMVVRDRLRAMASSKWLM